MDKKLKQELQGIIRGYRPRPLMYIGRHNGKKCYVRKQDLTYWQLREKYPPPYNLTKLPKYHHILQRHHYLSPSLLQRIWTLIKSLL